MSLASWMRAEHPFFKDLYRDLLAIIEARHIHDLDELVIASRRTVRTALLGLNELVRIGSVDVQPDQIVSRTSTKGKPSASASNNAAPFSIPHPLVERYTSLAERRETPALLWSQRRLVSSSAAERAAYILRWFPCRSGTVVFLGEDDLVSPLVAASRPLLDVHVYDIDAAVLETAERVSGGLGAKLQTHHADLSKAVLDHAEQADVVVSDPFPTGDGSFEAMFWSQVARILKPRGISITTIAPSHKPVGFDRSAFIRQEELGLALIDLQADFGRYETFPFEFSEFERQILQRLGLKSTVSMTKSLMAAVKVASPAIGSGKSGPDFDFAAWSSATADHYLTHQAGIRDQQDLTARRGAASTEDTRRDKPEKRTNGMRADLVLPDSARTTLHRMLSGARSDDQIQQSWRSAFSEASIPVLDEELSELIRLSKSAEVSQAGTLAELGLMVRAIESWERKRMDA
jgi:hypothetical protein